MLKRWPIVILQIPAGVTHLDAEHGFAVVIPDRPDFSYACAWCYGRPMPGQETCSRVPCITNWDAVRALGLEWRGHL